MSKNKVIHYTISNGFGPLYCCPIYQTWILLSLPAVTYRTRPACNQAGQQMPVLHRFTWSAFVPQFFSSLLSHRCNKIFGKRIGFISSDHKNACRTVSYTGPTAVAPVRVDGDEKFAATILIPIAGFHLLMPSFPGGPYQIEPLPGPLQFGCQKGIPSPRIVCCTNAPRTPRCLVLSQSL